MTTIPEIMNKVEYVTGVTRDQILAKSRLHRFVRARQIIAYIAYHQYRYSMYEIGGPLNRHYSVIHDYLRKVEGYLSFGNDYDGFRSDIDRAMRMLKPLEHGIR